MKYLLLLLLSLNANAIIFNDSLLTGGSMAADVCSTPLQINNFTGYSLQAKVVGATAEGSILLQASDDNIAPAGIVNWIDIANSTVSVSGSGITFYNTSDAFYKYVKLCYIRTSGTGTLDVIYNVKEGK